jgi:hypothetical protein
MHRQLRRLVSYGMDESLVYPIYFIVKYLSYCLWSYYGLKLLRNQSGVGAAVGFGSARLGLGMLFGVSVFFVGAMMHLNVPAHPWTLYLSIYAPLRYVEWTILAALMISSGNAVRRISEGVTQRWILGGIVISHLADLPLILFTYEGAKGFLPVGRFLC